MKQFYKHLPVLVTGGAGFIGSHLVKKLVELEAHVTVLDNLQTGFLKNLESVFHKIIFCWHNGVDRYLRNTLKMVGYYGTNGNNYLKMKELLATSYFFISPI